MVYKRFEGSEYGIQGFGPNKLLKTCHYVDDLLRKRPYLKNRQLPKSNYLAEIHIGDQTTRGLNMKLQHNRVRCDITYSVLLGYLRGQVKKYGLENGQPENRYIVLFNTNKVEVDDFLKNNPSIKKLVRKSRGAKLIILPKNYEKVRKLIGKTDFEKRLHHPENLNEAIRVDSPSDHFISERKYIVPQGRKYSVVTSYQNPPPFQASVLFLHEFLGNPESDVKWLRKLTLLLQGADKGYDVKMGDRIIDTAPVRDFFIKNKTPSTDSNGRIKEWYKSIKTYPELERKMKRIRHYIEKRYGAVVDFSQNDGRKVEKPPIPWSEINFSPRGEHHPLADLPD